MGFIVQGIITTTRPAAVAPTVAAVVATVVTLAVMGARGALQHQQKQ